ncbi:SDR family NAD(P)-dependent oxidoreductase [Luteimonas sp. e5]
MQASPPVILVTGASRGIGRAVALSVAASGARLALIARDTQALESTTSACRDAGAAEVWASPLDLADVDAISAMFRDLSGRFGQLDGLVNNAGILHEGLLGMIRPDDIDRVLAINVRAPLMLMQLAARIMSRRKQGSVVNVVSIMGSQGAAGLTLYSASKAALIGATRAAAKELAPRGIRVNAVAPGFIDTDMTRGMPEQAHAKRVSSIGMGRPGRADEVADVITSLLGPQFGYVTGQVIGIDGQMSV